MLFLERIRDGDVFINCCFAGFLIYVVVNLDDEKIYDHTAFHHFRSRRMSLKDVVELQALILFSSDP